LQLVVDNLWISRPGCSMCCKNTTQDVGVRHFVARHFVAGARASYARLRSRPLNFAT